VIPSTVHFLQRGDELVALVGTHSEHSESEQ